MKSTAILIVGLLLGVPIASAAVEPGAKVVLIRPIAMKTITGSTVALSPGVTFTARAVENDRLKVAAGRVGWVAASDIVPTDEADAHFTKLIVTDPNDADALLARGKVRFDRGDNDSAIADFDKALRVASNSEALTLRGYAWKRKGDKDRGMADLDHAIKINPEQALAWRVRGATWAGKAEYAKAVADYTEAFASILRIPTRFTIAR